MNKENNHKIETEVLDNKCPFCGAKIDFNPLWPPLDPAFLILILPVSKSKSSTTIKIELDGIL